MTPTLALAGLLGSAPLTAQDVPWPAYGGGPENLRYSELNQINRDNVHLLEMAWVHHTGDPGETQCQPIVVRAVLYCTSSALKAFALRADTGEELWRFDPFAATPDARGHVNRGVVYWEDGNDRRILFTAGPRLYALDAATGRSIVSFGNAGSVDLRAGLGEELGEGSVVATTPGVLYGDLLIQGTRVGESTGAAPGHVRAYDVRTGALRWTFHTIPRPGEYGYETWPEDAWRTAGGANSWAGMSVDLARGVVYLPTGSAAPDFYGGDRLGENLFANSVLALNAATGERIWHYQTVQHDLWDRDLPAPPNLVTLSHQGRRVDALAQITKSGYVFVLDRDTGEPLFPIEQRKVAVSDLQGEVTWPTQPVPLLPPPFARQQFTEDDITDISPESHAAVLQRFRTLRSAGQFVPPSEEGTIVFPGFDGGGEWGGAAVDPTSGVLYVNSSEMPWIAAMVETEASTGLPPRSAEEVYTSACAGCHGPDRRGGGDRGPSLVGIGNRRTAAQIREVIEHGSGFMPSFATLPEGEKAALVEYLTGLRPAPTSGVGAEPSQVAGRPPAAAPATPAASASEASVAAAAPRYRFRGYERFLDPDGYPAVKPPWGTLNAIDLNRGELLWKVPLGELPELTARGIPATGTENYGGPIVTGGGLVFIGASKDGKFRAFDQETGEILWETQLPAGGYATPSSYSVGGRQFVVIASGGGKMGTPSADTYVAFALPDGRF